mmetsp:Transcript_16703/g.41738  ORF Transcript_16703/g.41738 Transcript_16703/m.41738 type:complete len:101 (-) Transcript_16703:34-336(-)
MTWNPTWVTFCMVILTGMSSYIVSPSFATKMAVLSGQESVGAALGEAVVGEALGDSDGEDVGTAEGDDDGEEVGTSDGDPVGAEEGEALFVGASLGASLG